MPIDVTFAEKISEFTWPLTEIDPSLPADWSDHGFLVLEIRTSSTQRFSLWLHTATGKRRLMLQPFGQNVWLRASIPLQYFKGRDPQGWTSPPPATGAPTPSGCRCGDRSAISRTSRR